MSGSFGVTKVSGGIIPQSGRESDQKDQHRYTYQRAICYLLPPYYMQQSKTVT